MKTYICSCGRRRLVEDFIIMVICSRCLGEMKEFKEEVKRNDKKEDS